MPEASRIIPDSPKVRCQSLTMILILALPESIGPLAEQRSGAGKVAVTGDDLIQFGAVEEAIVDGIATSELRNR
jgi:hypothetical protein